MNKENIEAIIRNASVCRLGIFDGESPYVVPLCFGYRDNTLYFHGAVKSGKYALIQKHPKVCFEFDILAEPLTAPDPCDWDMRYQSVVGFGEASMVEGIDEKRQALEIIAAQYDKGSRTFPDNKVRATAVFKVAIASMTGKQSGFDPE
ncbi:antibiotic transporter [Desulfosarcina alkanivorans]|jgi:nitroimidazol reductase NimA-like FMN-containing flavoprotein (pyridoxamine 5'-phosphate oxidase superfamily)|uniref:Antibiotic transporter n=1 Tax=Desulfosarcina alkanivorans TaxID=571177 RepID=A0A5K7YPH9_9BACT|nr:pyridoxamine 5'-phosphate oxidase family protein [Desulfosarcina alkanivorans]BBO71126.1 antibiotic transporter [Desulfosarcina alkanivorans]